jgi:hypothetical protein
MTQHRITSPFGAASTAAEVLEGIDLRGKRSIVTGASSGIGLETARALATAGADVTIAVRNPDAGRGVADDINTALGQERVAVRTLDLADLSSVHRFAEQWGSTALDVLINNAGIMATPLGRTRSGWESQFATNHLGHFALANALHDALAHANGARIVSLSSRGHLSSDIVFDDINFDNRECVVRSRGDPPLGTRRNHGKRAASRRDLDQLDPTSARERVQQPARGPHRRVQVTTAGSGDIRVRRHVTPPPRHRGTLLRRQQSSRPLRGRTRASRSRRLRPQP